MRELSLNILDIVQNSVSAQAKNVLIEVTAKDNILTITIQDDGKGMTAEFLSKVTDPFTTTRTTRKVGMGLSLFQQEAHNAGGQFTIQSAPNQGTTVQASFTINHIDRLPLGDLASTVSSLILTAPDINYKLHYAVEDRQFQLCTSQIKQMLDGVPIQSLQIIAYIKEMLTENIKEVNGGISL